MPRSYTDRTPARDDEVGRYASQLAEAMDRRTERLGEEAAQSPPTWATERLGPVPDDPTARAEWTTRAASVVAYREHFGHEDPANPIGEAPGRGEPERRVAWQQAASALGMARNEQDLAARSEGELRNHVATYDRETEWMPPNVDDRLRVAHLAQREAEGGAARRQAEQDAMLPGDPRRDAHAQRVQQARALADVLAQRTARLEEIAEARAAAVASVADVEERARAARAELRRRGLDLAEDREREQAGERRDAERHHDAINVPSRDAPREAERPDIAPERGEATRDAQVDDHGEPPPERDDDGTSADRRIERDLERARAAMARIAQRREAERHDPERGDEHERVRDRDGIDIGDER